MEKHKNGNAQFSTPRGEKTDGRKPAVATRKKGTYKLKGSTGAIYVPADIVQDPNFPLKKNFEVWITIKDGYLMVEQPPRMEHVNTYVDHATIYDNKIDGSKHVGEIDIYFSNDAAMCDYCKRLKCKHVKFALGLREVQEAYRRKGLKIPET